MDQAIEIYSLDFDKQYIEEEEILKRVENFAPQGSGEPLFLPMREAGGEFWPSIRQQDETKRAIQDLKTRLQEVEKSLGDLDTKQEQYDEYLRTKEHQQENPKDENGEDWPELAEPEMDQE